MIRKDFYNKFGHLPRCRYKHLSKEDKILAYMLNFDRTNGRKYKLSDAIKQTKLIDNFIWMVLGIREDIHEDDKLTIVCEHLKKCKRFINDNHQKGLLSDYLA